MWDEDATELLKEGIRANMQFYNLYAEEENQITETEINTYLQNIPETSLKEIITQKWISFAYEQGYEAYAEFRRTSYPELTDYFDNPINMNIYPLRIPLSIL